MLKEDIYKSIIVVCIAITVFGRFFSISAENSDTGLDLINDIAMLVMVISIFLWKPTRIIAIGAIVFVISLNLDSYSNRLMSNLESLQDGLVLYETSFYLLIVAVVFIGFGWWRDTQLKSTRLRSASPLLTILTVLVISMGTQFILTLL